MSTVNRATAEHGRTKPMPPQKAPLEVEAVIDADAFERIKRGYMPQSSHDKWFLYVDDEQRLHCHRAATGTCIFTVDFERQTEDSYTMSAVWANRNPQQYRNDDPVYDARLLIFLIRRLLLGHEVPFPMPRGMEQDNAVQHHEHVMGQEGGRTRPSEGDDEEGNDEGDDLILLDMV